jgi:uncharacterized repeat protein (TIGR01451 family)
LTVTTNATGSPHTVSLAGLGTAPKLAIAKTVAPTSGVAYHGLVTYTLVLSNEGSADAAALTLTDTLPISVATAFWAERPAGATESSGLITWNGTITASAVITFSFAVTHTGGYGETITNTAEYSHRSPYGPATSGGTAQASFSVLGPPQADLSPSSLDFGQQLVGRSSLARPVILTNTGESPLAIAEMAATGEFSYTHTCSPSLLAGASCTIYVAFQPTTTSPYTGTLTVTTDAAGSPHTVSLLGLGAAPDLAISQAVTPTLALPGQTLHYSLAFANLGSYTATSLVITSCGGITNLTALAPGKHGNLSFTRTLPIPLPVGAFVPCTATISGGEGEVITTNNTSLVTVTVGNAPPAIAEGEVLLVRLNEDSPPISQTLHATDANGDELGWQVAAAAGHGTAALAGNGLTATVTYTPETNYNGADSLTVSVADGQGGTDVITVQFAITPVNDAPVLSPIGAKTITEGVGLTFTVTAEDVDGPELVLSAASLPPGASFDAATGVFSWTPGCEAAGVYTATFSTSDGALSDSETISITVIEACSTHIPLVLYLPMIAKDTGMGRILYLPLVARNYPPPPRSLLGPFPAIAARAVRTPGEIFYTATLFLAEELPSEGYFYFSAAPDRVVPVTVDDQLALTRGGQDIFSYTFSTADTPPAAAVVEIPRTAVTHIAAGDVVLEYRDVYKTLVSADALWLIWVP